MDEGEEYEIICDCGGRFTVRLSPDRYGCVRCCAEVELPPLWLDFETDPAYADAGGEL